MWLRDQTLNSLFCPHHCTQEYCCCLVTVLFHFLIILSALSHELSLSGRRCDPLGKEQIVCFCDVLQCDVNLIWLFLNSNLRTCCKKPSKLCVCVCVCLHVYIAGWKVHLILSPALCRFTPTDIQRLEAHTAEATPCFCPDLSLITPVLSLPAPHTHPLWG